MRPLWRSFLREPSRKEGHGARQDPLGMLPSPRSLVSVTGVNLKKSFFFLAFLAELAHPKSRCMADGRQLVEGKKGQARFHLLSGARASMTMPNGKQCAAERDPWSGHTCVAVVSDGRSGLQYV